MGRQQGYRSARSVWKIVFDQLRCLNKKGLEREFSLTWSKNVSLIPPEKAPDEDSKCLLGYLANLQLRKDEMEKRQHRISAAVESSAREDRINHMNIVKLLGCCLEYELVYKYVSNGTLALHLHGEGHASTLSWDIRLVIAAEVAGALAYLHAYASTSTFHRDVKSGNNFLLRDV
ncbi:hypothetical protein RJ640_012013 [Escallonia rubra]|uniref:Protein kinase domain-containing protein n=1 Tax=Escallonia rubra TaxID=112253 RepID=A0AA88UQJ9_9ASTE|nr:hypothetical protein RJ640_012013 [Escallonia rubra]